MGISTALATSSASPMRTNSSRHLFQAARRGLFDEKYITCKGCEKMATQRMRPDLLPCCNCQAWCVWRWHRPYRLCLLALLGCRTNQNFTFCSPFIGTALNFHKSNGHAQSTQQGQFCSQSDSWQDKHRSNTQNLSGSGNVTVLICIDIVSHSSLQLGQPKPDLFPMQANKMPT